MPHTKVATKTQVTGKVEAEYIQYVIKHLYSVQEVPIVNPKIVNLPEGVTFEQLVGEEEACSRCRCRACDAQVR